MLLIHHFDAELKKIVDDCDTNILVATPAVVLGATSISCMMAPPVVCTVCETPEGLYMVTLNPFTGVLLSVIIIAVWAFVDIYAGITVLKV
jgi:hypothetical protein